MPHSGGGGSSGGGSHGGGGHGGSSGTSRSRSYFPGSHHHVYFYRGKQVSYYSREPIPRTRPPFPVAQFVFSLLFGLFFMMGCLVSSILPMIAALLPSSYPKLPERLAYPVEYIDDKAGDIRLSAAEEADIVESLLDFADETKIPVCFELVDYDYWYDHYESLEKYAYQSYVSRWTDEDHFLIVMSINADGVREEGLSYVNQWRFETMIGDDLHCLTTRQCKVFNDAFTNGLYQMSNGYPLQMALDDALEKLNLSLHTKQEVRLGERMALLATGLFPMLIFITVGMVIICLPLKRYKEKIGEFEYYEKNGFPETREEMLARYTKAMHVLSVCPNCGAPNDHNREVCEYCNSNLLKKNSV